MSWLGDVSAFTTRGRGGPGWTTWLRAIDPCANFIIFISFMTIVGCIVVFSKKRGGELPVPWLLPLLMVLVALCGLTHLCQAAVAVGAPCRGFTLVSVLTAIVAAGAAGLLPAAVRAVGARTSRERMREIDSPLDADGPWSARSQRELARANENLRARVKALEDMVKTSVWFRDGKIAVEELNELLAQLDSF
jgi:hypothetical protein